MGKYEPLARYLKSRTEDSWNATFTQVEEKLGFSLPRSAREHRAWWSNQKDGKHSQAAGWQEAGWETREVDLNHGNVRFERSATALSHSGHSDELWEKASKLSGIIDRDELIAAALDALIQREVAKGLIALGGSDPNAKAVPRRSFW